jgi:hypothetical protein
MAGFTQEVMSWGGLTGAVGILLAVITFLANQKVRKRAERIESDQKLSQAWDILGDRPGTTWIFGANNTDDNLEQARRLITEALLRTPNYPRAHM